MEKSIWSDKKRIFGKPISLTEYSLSESRLFIKDGFIRKRKRQILLYCINDIETSQSFIQKIFNVGDIKITSSDKNESEIKIINVKNHEDVSELINKYAEKNKKERNIGMFMNM